jgi:hypothetical protein
MTERPALTERQRAAVDTAAAVFDSLVEPPPVAPFPSDGDGGPRAGVAAAVGLFFDVVQRIVDGYVDLAEQVGAVGSNGSVGSSGEPITLHARPGETAEAPVWIHNMGPRLVRGIALRLTGLTAADGAELKAGPAAFEPGELAVGPAASGQAVLTVPVPTDAAPGSYHGHVLGSGETEAAVPVRLVVQS